MRVVSILITVGSVNYMIITGKVQW